MEATTLLIRDHEAVKKLFAQFDGAGDAAYKTKKDLFETIKTELLIHMLIAWYRGSACAFCHEEIPEIHWSDHNPAILSPEGRTIEWSDVRPEDLPNVFATHRRVCWNCHIAQSFRASFPGLAIERPERTGVHRAS